MTLSRNAILKHVDARIGRVNVEEMGGEVCIASLTVAEADKLRELGKNGVPSVVELVVMCACDDKGARLFTPEDNADLARLPASALGKIANAILTHNGIAPDATEEAKNGSSETEIDASDSASLSPSDEPSPN